MKETEGLGTRSKPRSPPFVRGGAPFTTWQGRMTKSEAGEDAGVIIPFAREESEAGESSHSPRTQEYMAVGDTR